MKKVLSVWIVIMLLIFGTMSLAEQLPSPVMPQTMRADVTGIGNIALKEDFGIFLYAESQDVATLLTDIQQLVETEKIVNLFDEASQLAAVEYLPENYNMEDMMLAELYSLTVNNYLSEYGDVEAVFEFAVNYADDAILLGMIGIVPRVQEGSDEIVWTPVLANTKDGCVVVTINQELLMHISKNEQAVFMLLQDQR